MSTITTTTNYANFFEGITEFETIGMINPPMESDMHRFVDVRKLGTKMLGKIRDVDWYRITGWINRLDLTMEVVEHGLRLIQGFPKINNTTIIVAIFLASKFYEDYAYYNQDMAEEIGLERDTVDYYEVELLKHNNWIIHRLINHA